MLFIKSNIGPRKVYICPSVSVTDNFKVPICPSVPVTGIFKSVFVPVTIGKSSHLPVFLSVPAFPNISPKLSDQTLADFPLGNDQTIIVSLSVLGESTISKYFPLFPEYSQNIIIRHAGNVSIGGGWLNFWPLMGVAI